MELRSIGGVPAHPLFVHAVVVLLPLAGIALIVAALVPKWRRVAAPIALGLALASVVSVFFTEQSGETLEKQVAHSDAIEEHTEAADAVMPWAIGVALVSGAAVAIAFKGEKLTAKVPTKAVSGGLLALALVSGIGASITVIDVGHSGAKAVWGTTADKPVGHGDGDDHRDGD